MARFTYVCLQHDERVTRTVNLPSRPSGDILCPDCSQPMQRALSNTNVVIKGASESNGYYVPESNAALGLPSALDMEKNIIRTQDEFLDSDRRDEKKDWDREKGEKAEKLNKRVAAIEKKYPGWTETYKKVMKDKVSKAKKFKK